MNAALSITTLLAVVCLSWAATPEYKAKVITAVTTCAKEHNAELKDILEIMRQNKLPETKEQKCVVGCFFEKMEYVTDNKVDWEKVKALNPQKYDTPELVEKVNQVTDECAKVVTGKYSDICELGTPAIKCLKEEAEKIQLPKPDVKFDLKH
uniref:Putative odorant-binding protein 4 n=1 Tax=Euschistus heros TaxID=437493 RepID=A0A097QH79_EUSHE|nr:putative odorant-binding protein 4 [Euschistus heros]